MIPAGDTTHGGGGASSGFPIASGVESDLISTGEAAELLGVKATTIYTYVSRGRLQSLRKPGEIASWFRRADVERLALSRRPRRPEAKGRSSVVETSITEIDGITYRYRGRSVEDLMATYSFEQVAEFLWTGVLSADVRWESRHSRADTVMLSFASEALPLDRLRAAVAALAASDRLRLGSDAGTMVATARHLMVDMIESLPLLGSAEPGDSIATRLWARLSSSPPTAQQVEVLDRVLTVIADHGVAPSTLAARVTAAYRADLYGAVEAGLAVVAGGWHGGRALSAERMLDEIPRVGDIETVVGDLYRRGGIPCLGQPRYPNGDPRTGMLSDLVEVAAPGNRALVVLDGIRQLAEERVLPPPSVELALAMVARAFDFTDGASEALFAIGRAAGWIAHALEAYAKPVPSSPEFSYRSTALTDATFGR